MKVLRSYIKLKAFKTWEFKNLCLNTYCRSVSTDICRMSALPWCYLVGCLKPVSEPNFSFQLNFIKIKPFPLRLTSNMDFLEPNFLILHL